MEWEGKGKEGEALGKSIEFVRQISAQMEIDRKATERRICLRMVEKVNGN